MRIIKRDGSVQDYESEKILSAIKKSFDSTGASIEETELKKMLSSVEDAMNRAAGDWEVEHIQDTVELALMEAGHFEQAKAFILYRQKRTELRRIRRSIVEATKTPELNSILLKIQKDFDPEQYSLLTLNTKFMSFLKDDMDAGEALGALSKAAIELTTKENPKWDFIAGRILNKSFRVKLDIEMKKRGIKNLYEKLRFFTDEELYGYYILSSYSREEINTAEGFIDDERDELFTYSGLDLLLKRYVVRSRRHVPLETPQEMFLGIALHLAMKEKKDRLVWVKKFYDMLSTMRVTMATPTMANARKPFHQLSSCFIDVVPDSLDGIYRSVDNFARVSKFGGGMGMYFGKVRALGSSIRGYEGAAGGVIRWIRIVNDTAVAVDQLGIRAGAVAVYLDAWHKDLPEFLQLRTNNGDDRMKAHDVFPAVCYPDLFWQLARDNIDAEWHLFCPHEIQSVKGYCLEDYYGEEWERRYKECVADPRISRRTYVVKDLVRLILKSAVETGTPFAFYRDTVNRANPNPHKGMIYCSNLCTEIAQNMSMVEFVSDEVETTDNDTVVVTRTRPGDFVVCNLASLSLGNIPLDDEEVLKETVQSTIRALDNVIDLNYYPLPYAKITNKHYRAVGLGVSGYHHMLAKNHISWESDRHLEFVDALFEKINMYAIEASTDIAAEKGRYDYFAGSEWDTGEYFSKRRYDSEPWMALREKVKNQGMRNAYLLSIAPTSSTSILSGTTPGVDPVMHKFFLEEKKGTMLPRVAPELSPETFWYYKNAHTIDQEWSIRAAGVRQRHIDQAQSVNLYITNDFKMRQVMNLYIKAWENGVKTLYYVRSRSLEVEECESCSS